VRRTLAPIGFDRYLVGMITVALIPALVLAVAVVTRNIGQQRRELRSVLRHDADAVSTMLDARLADQMVVLKTLSLEPGTRSGASAPFAEAARTLLAGYPDWESVTLASPTAPPLVVRRGAAPPPSSQPLAGAGTGTPPVPNGETVGIISPASPGGPTTIALGVPVERDGKIVAGLWARVLPSNLLSRLKAQARAAGWTLMIIDDDGTVVAATRRRLVGRRFPYGPWQEFRNRQDGVVTGRALDGTPMYIAFRRSDIAHWTVANATPIGPAFAPTRHPSFWGWALVGAVAFPLLLVGLAAGSLRRRMRELAAAAANVSPEGPWLPVPPSGVREIDAVHDALRRARAALVEGAENRERVHEAEVALLHAQRAEAVGHLASAIAHDFGNLALVVHGRLELIQRAAGDQRRVESLIEPALSLCTSAGSMMSDLARTLRTEATPSGPAQLNSLVGDMRDLVRRAAGRGVRVEFLLRPELWLCSVNATMFRSAVFNLVVNAKAAMPKGGTLRIETRNVTIPPDNAETDGVPAGEYVLLAIADTGAGIPPEIVSQIFDPLFTTRRSGRGTGLGLAIVREFVHQAGGHVRVASEIGVGTSFFLHFPRRIETEQIQSHDSVTEPLTLDRVP
jgi:signal transduction histidine kinase